MAVSLIDRAAEAYKSAYMDRANASFGKRSNGVDASSKTEKASLEKTASTFDAAEPKDEFIKTGSSQKSSAGLYSFQRGKDGSQSIVFEHAAARSTAVPDTKAQLNASEQKAAANGSDKSGQMQSRTAEKNTDTSGANALAAGMSNADAAGTREAAGKSEKAEANSENGSPAKASGDPGNTRKTTADTDAVDKEIERLKNRRQQLKQRMNSAQNDAQRAVLEQQLSQLDTELRVKDTDAYRKQNARYSTEA